MGKRGDSKIIGFYFFSMENENKNKEQDFFVHHRIVSAVKRVEFVSDRLS